VSELAANSSVDEHLIAVRGVGAASILGSRGHRMVDDQGFEDGTPLAATSFGAASPTTPSAPIPWMNSPFEASPSWPGVGSTAAPSPQNASMGTTSFDSREIVGSSGPGPEVAVRRADSASPRDLSGAPAESADSDPRHGDKAPPATSSATVEPGFAAPETLSEPAPAQAEPVSAEANSAGGLDARLAGSAVPLTIFGQDTTPFNATPAQVRQAMGATGLTVDGTGVKVGVISNSFNNKGGAASDEAAGLLPAASRIHVLQDLPFTAGSPNDDEGRAMMQVVHDIAPGASLDFCTFAGTAADFANNTAGSDQAFADAILALAADGCKVICDDIGFTGIPWFQDSVIGQAIQTVEQEGVTYLVAAGNERSGASATSTVVNDPGYQSAWRATSIDLSFNDGLTYSAFTDALDFGGGNPFQTVTLAAGAHTEFEMEWNQPWGDATSNLAFIVTIGDGIVLEDEDGDFAAFTRSENETPNGETTTLANDPYVSEAQDPNFPELFNDTDEAIQFQVSIVNLSGPDPGFVKYMSNGNGNPPDAVTISGANAGTSVGHQESPDAITVGAADAGNTPAFGNSPPLSEYFSSSGTGDQWFYDADGNPLPAAQLLNVVDVTGVDDIDTSGSSLGDFFGTSCATPSVAGVVALMLQANANINPSDVQNLLQDSAIPMINPVVSGAGLAQASSAVSFAKTLTITGNANANVLLGTHLDDTIDGLGGDDILVGGAGVNFLDGGPGADELDGSGGTSFASYADATTGVTVNLTHPASNTGDAAGDTYVNVHDVLGSKFDDTIVGDSSDDTLEGGAGNDKLYGEAGKDTLTGGAGVNYLDGGAGADTLIGTGGTSYATYSDSPAGLTVDLANPALDTGDAAGDVFTNILGVYGSNFNDTIVGNNSGDHLYGGAGADTITGGTGADYLYGGAGDDTLSGGAGINYLDGGPGADKLIGTGGTSYASYSDATAGVTVNLATPGSNTGDAAGDTYVGVHDVLGSAFNDVITGDGSGDLLYGGAGDDTITGGAGNDKLYGQAGNDTLTGGAGVNYLDGGAGADALIGTGGTSYASYADSAAGLTVDLANPALDTGDAAGDVFTNILGVYGSNFNDTIVGNNSGDHLYGAAGDDTITGGTGADYLFGGAGNDTLSGGAGVNYLDGGAGADALIGTGGTSYASYSDSAAGLTVDLANPALDTGDAVGDVFTNILGVYGSSFNDTIVGNNSGDHLYGAAGADKIMGGSGNDSITGGAGADVLTGGLGADQFVYNSPSEGGDTITDFSHAQGDRIVISHAGFGGGLSASGSLNANELVVGSNPAPNIAAGQFLFNTSTSALSWDADGTGAGAAVNIATLTGVTTLTAADIRLF
jgi:Ca2+-binding RTX toxin-like protein